MSLQRMRWEVEPRVGEQEFSVLPDEPPLVVQLLYNRGIKSQAGAADFLSGRVVGHSPFRMKGMNEAVSRLRRAIRQQERIAVYGDFDSDGVTATALLVQVLSAMGASVEPYIPDRVAEGYGLNLAALRKLYRRGVRVVITVDCGIRSHDEVAEASKGMDIIVTDHHSVADEVPAAVAVIDPKQPDCPYAYEGLAGVGVAFKLAQALLRVQGSMGQRLPVDENSLVDLVALGTVADLVPLLDENRSLVRRGLEVINGATRPGIEALMADAGLRRGEVDATAIGFRLGPRLNAAGRIDHAMLAYDLLTSTVPLETKELAERLGKLNRQRQDLTKDTVAIADEQVRAGDPEARLLMAISDAFNPGIVGLAASRLTEAYYRPAVVVELGKEESRGSCRSIREFNITKALDECQDLLIRHGGHPAAAGFTVATENLGALRQRLQAIAAEQLAGVELRPTLQVDVEIPLDRVDWATHTLLSQMEPCGMDNRQPVLVSRDVAVRDQRSVGTEGSHLKLALADSSGTAWDAIAFRQGELLGHLPNRIDLAYTLEVNEWNHRKRLQLNVRDIREAENPGRTV